MTLVFLLKICLSALERNYFPKQANDRQNFVLFRRFSFLWCSLSILKRWPFHFQRGSQRVNTEGTQEHGLHPSFISWIGTRKLSAVKSFCLKEPERCKGSHSRPEKGRNRPRSQGWVRETALALLELWVTSRKHPSELPPHSRTFQCTWIIPQLKIQLFHKGISNENSKSK